MLSIETELFQDIDTHRCDKNFCNRKIIISGQEGPDAASLPRAARSQGTALLSTRFLS